MFCRMARIRRCAQCCSQSASSLSAARTYWLRPSLLLRNSPSRSRLVPQVACKSRSEPVAWLSGVVDDAAVVPEETRKADSSENKTSQAPSSRRRGGSYSSTKNKPISLRNAVKKVGEFCDNFRYPLGSLTVEIFRRARALLFMLKDENDTSAVNASFQLLERLVWELAHSKDEAQLKWLCDPRQVLNPLCSKWKDACIERRDESVISARDLVQKLQSMSSLLPEFKLDVVTFNIVLNVEIARTPPHKAPLVAESLLAFLNAEAAQTNNLDLRPTFYTYGPVLQAWAVSNLPEASERIEALLSDMRNRNISLNVSTCTILSKFWSNKCDFEKVEAMFKDIQDVGIKTKAAILSGAFHGYAKAGRTARAEELLQRIIADHRPGNESDQDAIADCVLHIMAFYRRMIVSEPTHIYQTRQMIDSAEALVRKMDECGILATESSEKMMCTMMDIYALTNKLEKAESIFTRVEPDITKYELMIKAYGKSDNADQATRAVHAILSDARIQPGIRVFTSLLNALAECSRRDVVEEAFAVVRLLEENPRCVDLGIRPDVPFFHALLKCLSASNSSDVGSRSEAVLDDMGSRFLAGDIHTKPNAFTFTLAIKACLHAGDLGRADAIMKRMEKSDTPPNVRTYNNILQHYSQLGTPAAAERTEQILAYVKDLSTSNTSVQPDVVSYNIALAGWARSGASDSAGRMWTIYEQMMADKINPSMSSYNTMITFFARSNKKNVLAKAKYLLQEMTNSNQLDVRPDYRHFNPVLNGFLRINDAANATELLVRYIDVYTKYNNEVTKPNLCFFDEVTKAWMRAGDLAKATSFLEKIQQLHDTKLLPEGPNHETYRALLVAWTRSSHPDKNVYATKLYAKLASFAC